MGHGPDRRQEFGKPVYVGDPGAKGVQPEDKVVIEMVHFPSQTREGEGVIVEVSAPRPSWRRHDVDHLRVQPSREFDDDVLADSRKQADLFDESIGRGRRDLTDLPIVTIDPVDARDFDDAISLERTDKATGCLVFTSPMCLTSSCPKHHSTRSPRTRNERLPARSRHPDAAGDHLQQSGQPAAAQSSVRHVGHDGVHRRRRSRRDDVFKSAIKSRRRFTMKKSTNTWQPKN